MKRVLLASFLGLALASVGCGKVQLNLDEGSNDGGKGGDSLTAGAEFVSAAQKSHRTPNGFVVDTATGAVLSRMETQTASGFKVFSTVQGSIVAEDQINR